MVKLAFYIYEPLAITSRKRIKWLVAYLVGLDAEKCIPSANSVIINIISDIYILTKMVDMEIYCLSLLETTYHPNGFGHATDSCGISLA